MSFIFELLAVFAVFIVLYDRGARRTLQERVDLQSREMARLWDEIYILKHGEERPDGGAPSEIAQERAPESIVKSEPVTPETVPPAEPVGMETADEPAVPGPSVASEPPPRKRSTIDLESAIGARWSVIVGGIAVALGAVFLVRYTIEAGLLGPKIRIALAALFSIFLFAAGEWLRRRDKAFAIAAIPNADIPGILTGAGSVGAFATVYAAYSIYGFVGPAVAFVLLTLVGLASLVLSVVHGPKLAALGVVGAYATPLLVSTEDPNPLALAAHVLVVTAAVMGTARLRGWLWLAFCGVAGGAGWTLAESTINSTLTGVSGLVLLLGLAVIFVAGFVWQQVERPIPPQDRSANEPATIAFCVLAVAFVLQTGINAQLPLIPAGLGTGLLVMAVAGLWPALVPTAIAATAIVLAAVAATDIQDLILPGLYEPEMIRNGLVPPDLVTFLRDISVIAVPVGIGAVWAAWRYGAVAKESAGWLATAAAAIGFFTLVIAYLRVAPFETRPDFGATGLLLAFIFAGLAEMFTRLDPEDNSAPAPAAFAVACVASLSFAISVSLDSGWMPLAFALASAGIALVYRLRPLAALPWLALAAAVIGAGSLWANLPFDAWTIGTTPFFNRLIILLGLPAVALIGGGEVLRRSGPVLPATLVGAIGLAVGGLFVGTELRHWLSGGHLDRPGLSLAEAAAQTLAALGFSVGMQRAGTFTGADLYRHASTVAGAIGAAFIALTLLINENPLFTDEGVGARPFFNLLLPGYFLTGIAAAFVARYARPIRPQWFTLGFEGLSAVLLLLFCALTVRHAFQGEHLGLSRGINLDEASAQTLVTLCLAAGFQWIGRFTSEAFYQYASIALTAICVVWVVPVLLVSQNPAFTNEAVGDTPFFNLLLPAYLLTGLVAALVAWQARPVRPRWFTLCFAALSGLLLFVFISLTVRHAFRGDSLGLWHATSDGEFWTYSAVWLVTGAALLALGLWQKSLPIRAASGALIALTICKVFLLDTAALSGFLRALSFIGLGLSLLAIGRFYQRLLRVGGRGGENPSDSPANGKPDAK